MSLVGMDPEAIDRVAVGLGQQAAALDGIAQHVDVLVRQALHAWPGPDAEDFHQWWTHQHRPRLTAAAQGVHGAVANLREQVRAQVEASGAGQGHAGPGSSGGLFGWFATGYSTVKDAVGGAGWGMGLAVAASRLPVVGRYPKSWPSSFGFLKYKSSPSLQWMHAHAKDLGKANSFLKGAGVPFAAVDAAGGGWNIGNALFNTRTDGKAWFDVASTSLETGAGIAKTKGGWVGYLGGAAAQAWSEVASAAKQADFSADGFTMVAEELARDPWGSLKAGVDENLRVMPGALGRIFKPW